MMCSLTPVTNNTIFFIVHLAAMALSYVAFSIAAAAAVMYLIQDRNLKKRSGVALFSRLPDLSVLDRFNYRSIGLGFPLLTLGIISGALLTKQALGVYWDWSVRNSYSLVLWLMYAITLHVRLTSKMRGRKVAWLSTYAFVIIGIIVLTTICGINK